MYVCVYEIGSFHSDQNYRTSLATNREISHSQKQIRRNVRYQIRTEATKSSLDNLRSMRKNIYEGRLISNAHSEIFCRRSKVAMRTQCVLVATTLLHSGAKFHSFLYTGSKTVRVNMESCYGGMSTRLKRRAVTEFLSAENVTPAEIHRRLQDVYGEDTVKRNTVNR